MLGFGQALMGAGARSWAASVFAPTLYTGTGATQAITTNIDLTGTGTAPLGTGGLVWIKGRSGATAHRMLDTARGVQNVLATSASGAEAALATSLTAFGASGFTVGADTTVNASAATYVAWTFRKAAGFFDAVTYTGDGTSNRAISHALGASPGMVVTKVRSASGNWNTYHRSASGDLVMEGTAAQAGSHAIVTAVSSTTFTVTGVANTNSATYVAYLFGHDATADGIIQCGTYTGNGSASGPTVALGWEPQYVLIKNASGTGNWYCADAARGLASGTDTYVLLNSAAADNTALLVDPSSTGFQITNSNAEVNGSAATLVYMAIRRP